MLKKALLNRFSRKVASQSEPISFDRANSVGILTVYEDNLDLDDLLVELEGKGKSPRLVTLITRPQKDKTYPKNCFTEKDISLTGTILSDELLYFTKQKYDFLLCLDSSGNNFIKYLLSKTQARHRIGFHHPNHEGLLDMMIKTGPDLSPVAEILKYLKMIRHD